MFEQAKRKVTDGHARGGVLIPSVLSILLVACLVLFAPTAAAYNWTSTGSPSSPGTSTIYSMALDGARHILYAGAGNGKVYRYRSGAWSSTGGPTTASSILDLKYDPVTDRLVAASFADHKVYSFREGGSWSEVSGLPGGFLPRAVASDGARNKLYAGGNGGTVYEYHSGVWSDIGTIANLVENMVFDTTRKILYAGCASPGGARVYSYNGSSWTPFSDVLGVDSETAKCLALDSRRNILYAGTSNYSTGHINVFRKNIGTGGDWTGVGALCAGYIMYDIVLDETNNTLYASAYDGHVYKNCDASAGSTWIDTGLVSPTSNAGCLQYRGDTATLYAGAYDGQVYRTRIPAVTAIHPPSGTQGQTMDVEITGSNAGFTAGSSALFSGDGVKVNSTTRLSPSRVRANITINPETYLGPRSVWVKTGGEKTNKLVDGFSVTAPPAPPEPVEPANWYLAEGSTAWGFETYITIQNPNSAGQQVIVTYMPAGQSNVTETINLPAKSQTTLTNDYIASRIGGQADFSTRVSCPDKTKPVAVDRTMRWTGEGAPLPEEHSSIGNMAPAKKWYLPEGSSAWGFECWLLVQNPGSTEASVDFTYMIEGVGTRTVNHKVKAASRDTFNMEADIGQHDASVTLTSDQPIIPERAMYKNNRREGHESIGTTAPAKDYYLAEGSTAWGFTTYVLVQNPQNTATDVTVSYLTPSGRWVQPMFTMDPNSRKTIRVNDIQEVSNTDLSVQVHGSQPIIAERAMYWGADSPEGEACHDSIGMCTPHETFYLPDGESSPDGPTKTWTLVQNPNATDVQIQVAYMKPDGTGNITFTDTVEGNSRKTYDMADKLEGRASIKVTCKTPGKKIMVERAMYWNGRGGGSETIGGYSD